MLEPMSCAKAFEDANQTRVKVRDHTEDHAAPFQDRQSLSHFRVEGPGIRLSKVSKKLSKVVVKSLKPVPRFENASHQILPPGALELFDVRWRRTGKGQRRCGMKAHSKSLRDVRC